MNEDHKIYSGVECTLYANTTEGYVLEDKPIVTVSVIAYNSSKYIIETLDSIKNQTYHNLILQISDDCSDDNTIEICKKWIDDNQSRFVKTKIIVPSINTGVSANCNRIWDECETEWVKDIAGDDLLLPDCIETYMTYVYDNPNPILIFGKALTFSTIKGVRVYEGYLHDYNYFNLSPEELHHKLIWEGNRLPAASAFYNVEALKKKGVRHDTRIRNIEDYPKWIKLSSMGVKFHFIDKDTVLYRHEETSLSVGLFSPNYFNQEILLCLYYYLDEIKSEKEKDIVFKLIAEHCTHFYKRPYNRATTSIEFKIGRAILAPLKILKRELRYLGIVK